MLNDSNDAVNRLGNSADRLSLYRVVFSCKQLLRILQKIYIKD